MTIPALPDAPALGDSPEVFNTKAFAFVAALDDWGAAANATAVAVDADAAAADADAATATTQAGIATTGANTATTQAGIATTKAGEAATSANLADASADAANLSAIAAAASAASIDPATLVKLTGDQTVAGVKTFTSKVIAEGLTVGKGAGNVATNTAVGASALAATTSGGENTAIGYQALNLNTTGAYNVAIGKGAAQNTTTPNGNTAVGTVSLNANTTGSSNVAMGFGSLQNNTTASYSTAVGYQALYTNTGTANTAVGYQAGLLVTSGTYNTLIGAQAGSSLTTGSKNYFFGGTNGAVGAAGSSVTTGSANTILGAYTGNQGGLDIRTASNQIVLSDGDGNPRLCHTGAAIRLGSSTYANRVEFDGAEFYAEVDNTIKLGYPSNRWTVVYATTGTINTSDATQKQDIAALDDAEKRVAVEIKSLIKKYRFKDSVAEKGDAARIHIGAVAQEVQAAFVAEGLDPARYALFCSDTWYEVDGKTKTEEGTFYTAETEGAVEVTRLGLRYEELLAFVIAAL